MHAGVQFTDEQAAALGPVAGRILVAVVEHERATAEVLAQPVEFAADRIGRHAQAIVADGVTVADVIRRRGTIYLLGREDPYASASPLMTALAEHVLDTALGMAQRSGWGRLCPPLLACLDELPSTAPLPTLRTRMANERALGLSFIWAAQTRAQLDSIFGQQEARAVLGLTNNLVLFGGSKDVAFNQEISDLLFVSEGTTKTQPPSQPCEPNSTAATVPALAAKPLWKTTAASVCLKAASFSSSAMWMSMVPAMGRTDPVPTP